MGSALDQARINTKLLRDASHVLVLAGRDFFKDDGPMWAAAIAYYSLLSLFPLLLALGSIAAYFVEPQWAVQQATGYLGDLLPRGSGAIERIVKQTIEAGQGGGLLFLVPLLWTGSLVFGAIAKALNIVYEAEDQYGFAKRMMVRVAMLLSLGAMFLVALASPLALRLLRATLGILPAASEIIFELIVNALPTVFLLLAFFLAYRFVPGRRIDWRAALFGGVIAALLFAAAKPLFLGFLQQMASYNLVYGSLSGIIVVVLWTWMVAMMGLFGGQISLHSQAVLIEGQPIEEVERRHLQRV